MEDDLNIPADRIDCQKLIEASDSVLLAIINAEKIPWRELLAMSASRAVMLAHLAVMAGDITLQEYNSVRDRALKGPITENYKTVGDMQFRMVPIPRCVICGTEESDVWWRCCPEHTPENGTAVLCNRCYATAHI